MTDMQDLSRAVRELENLLAKCTRCGMCQSVCPVYKTTRSESDVSRGKLILLEGLIDGLFEDPEGVNERLNRCLLCGSCESNCPSGVSAVTIFLKARGILTRYMGLSITRKIIFRKMLANPAFFKRLVGAAQRLQPLVLKKDASELGTSCARVTPSFLKSRSGAFRHVVPISDQPFHKTLAGTGKKEVASAGSPHVVFFTGCLIDGFFPGIARSAIQVFDHYKIGYTIPAQQGCCGIPALASGDTRTFESLVRHHIGLLESLRFDYLVTACATCTSTIKKLWGSMAGDENQVQDPKIRQQIASVAERTVDINWLLLHCTGMNQQDDPDDSLQGCVTYHDPCHLKKSLGISSAPRQVIRAAGYRLREMEAPDTCCGMGGSFNLSYYDISKEIGLKKGENIADTGCDIVATSCPACMMQISDVMASLEHNVQVRHPVELLAQKLSPV
ncbi:MAG: (Fe-S)-binding protein [Desulfobacteraceae bacterium]|nr:MAG: (Fe-S)-binding protein [Desulfobacteraceae bacterium]